MPDFLPAPVLFRIGTIGLVLAMSGPILAGPAQSQSNQRALDALGPVHGAPASKAAHPHATHHARTAHHPAPASRAAAIPSPPIPAAPPPLPAIKAPELHVPLHPEPPPPPVPVVATAVGAVSAIPGGSRITFGSGSADLNPTGMQALQALTARMKADPESRAQVEAYAGGTSDDPSTPRRMSLARGIAARAVLINGGIASTRIYVRAIGQPGDGSPADRIDVILSDPLPAVGDQPEATPGQTPAAQGAPATPGIPTAPSAPTAPTTTGAPTTP